MSADGVLDLVQSVAIVVLSWQLFRLKGRPQKPPSRSRQHEVRTTTTSGETR